MFIAADIQKRSLMRKKSQLEFTQMVKMNLLNSTAAKIKGMDAKAAKTDKANGNTVEADRLSLGSNSQYNTLQALQIEYDMAVESAESQLQLLKPQIDALGKLVQNNISQDNTLWCVGGS